MNILDEATTGLDPVVRDEMLGKEKFASISPDDYIIHRVTNVSVECLVVISRQRIQILL